MTEVPLDRRLEPDARLIALYERAGDLQLELERASSHGPNAPLSIEQIIRFNQILRAARETITSSIALREDVEEVDGDTRTIDAYHMLHVTVVPTLHNALPAELAAR